jgi:hypothetical protein
MLDTILRPVNCYVMSSPFKNKSGFAFCLLLGVLSPLFCPPAQVLGKFPGIESIGLHSLSRGGRHHRRRHYQTRMPARHQLIVQAKAGWPTFINKGHSRLAKCLRT